MLCFKNFLLTKKFMDERVWGVSRFSVENFCLIVPKKFVGQPFRVLLILGIENIYASESYNTSLRRKFFVSQCRNIS